MAGCLSKVQSCQMTSRRTRTSVARGAGHRDQARDLALARAETSFSKTVSPECDQPLTKPVVLIGMVLATSERASCTSERMSPGGGGGARRLLLLETWECLLESILAACSLSSGPGGVFAMLSRYRKTGSIVSKGKEWSRAERTLLISACG